MMNRKLIYGALSYGAIATVAMLGTTACVVRSNVRPPRARVTVRANVPPPPTANVTIQASTPQMGSGVTVVEATCAQGAQEACNGLDDNCNGIIDEGCGYQSGNIQITLGWATGADLDMYVTDPSGTSINYASAQAPSGGHLDHDARGNCASYQQGSYNTENVYWNQDQPPSGPYAVEVHYWDGGGCSTRAGQTQFTVSVAVGGQILGTWQNALMPGQRLPMVNFQI